MDKTKNIVKKLIKEPLLWFVIVLLILGTILLANFSTKIVYNVKYKTYKNNVIYEFNNKNRTAVMYDYNDVTERVYYNYFIKGDSIYLYNQANNSGDYTIRFDIKSKFKLTSEYGGELNASGAEDAFMTLMGINGFIAIIVVIVTIECIKDKARKKKIKENKSENISGL